MKILIATDGSDFSRKAVEKCCEILGKGGNAEIKVISLVEHILPMAAEPFAVSADYYRGIEESLRKQSEMAVAEAEQIIREKLNGGNVSIEGEVCTGHVKQIIVDEAKKWNADLIVMGSHGKGFFDRMMIGSVSDFVVHHAPCSVLVVRRDADENKE